MMGMPCFDDIDNIDNIDVLVRYESYADAIASVERNLAVGVSAWLGRAEF
jgi:hypothetical protein